MRSYECDVVRAGPSEDGKISILLRDRTGKFNAWFSTVADVKREMLSVALAALGGGRKVQASFGDGNGDPKEWETIQRLYML